jgi:hypothetical protein
MMTRMTAAMARGLNKEARTMLSALIFLIYELAELLFGKKEENAAAV